MTNKAKLKILYAEDEEDIRAITQIALEDIGGFEVTYCTNGVDVLSEMKKIKPDLLLLDVMMPVMDGLTVYNKLMKQQALHNIPVIFMTAKIQADEISFYRAMGVANVIAKPFDPMLLAEMIKQTWQQFNAVDSH